LNDIPDSYDLRLSDEFVNALDRINRPWLYDGKGKRGRYTKIWRADDAMFKFKAVKSSSAQTCQAGQFTLFAKTKTNNFPFFSFGV